MLRAKETDLVLDFPQLFERAAREYLTTNRGLSPMMAGFEQYTKKTRRLQFLEEMEQVVLWRELRADRAVILGKNRMR